MWIEVSNDNGTGANTTQFTNNTILYCTIQYSKNCITTVQAHVKYKLKYCNIGFVKVKNFDLLEVYFYLSFFGLSNNVSLIVFALG